MKLILRNYTLQLQHTFRISREATDTQPTLVVGLEANGHTGYGEATSNAYYGSTVHGMMDELEAVREQIEAWELKEPARFWKWMADHGLSLPARCALDMAFHDLLGKQDGRPLHEIWGTALQDYPTTNYTIGIASIPEMLRKMQERPWPIYKIKLGTEEDVAIVRELRKHSDAIFRIDANCAWTVAETLHNAPKLKELGVEFIEQPLPAGDWDGMKTLYRESVLPLIADESCVTEEDVTACNGHFHGINIKLVKCGGITPALRMIKEGRTLGLKIMMGCMTESTVGISAIAQMLPQLDFVDMDGAMLLARDIASGVRLDDAARVHFPRSGGTGVKLLP